MKNFLFIVTTIFLFTACFNGNHAHDDAPNDGSGFCGTENVSSQSVRAPEIFQAKCAACHLFYKNSTGPKMEESGKTDVLSYPAYYFHTKSNSGTYGESENIGFIIESDEEGYFYQLIAGASQTDQLERNMSIMVHSLKSFKIKDLVGM